MACSYCSLVPPCFHAFSHRLFSSIAKFTWSFHHQVTLLWWRFFVLPQVSLVVSSRAVFSRFQISSIDALAVLNAFTFDMNPCSNSFCAVCSFSFKQRSLRENVLRWGLVFSVVVHRSEVSVVENTSLSDCSSSKERSQSGFSRYRIFALSDLLSKKILSMTKSFATTKSSTPSRSALHSPYL